MLPFVGSTLMPMLTEDIQGFEIARSAWAKLCVNDQMSVAAEVHDSTVFVKGLKLGNVPHEFADGTASSIVNQDLRHLLCNMDSFFATKFTQQAESAFTFSAGGPGFSVAILAQAGPWQCI